MSPKKPEKKANQTQTTDYVRRANTTIRKRIMVLTLVFGVVIFLLLLGKLFQIQVLDHDFYLEKAVESQTRDALVSANRGKITDSKGRILAISASVHNVVLDPKQITEEKLDKDLIARGLSSILDVDTQLLYEKMKKTASQYEVVAKKVEDDVADQVRQFVVDNTLSRGISLRVDTKRYYPRSSLAAQVVGFVNSENDGAYGLENIYNGELAGARGRILVSKTARNQEMLSGFEAYVDAQEGHNLTLTLDTTIQGLAEQALLEGIERFEVLDGGFCIVMNPKTGAIYAAASMPNYDLNNYAEIKDPKKAAELEAMKAKAEQTLAEEAETGTPTVGGQSPVATEGDTEEGEVPLTPGETLMEEYQQALRNARDQQWQNKALNDSYEPGSTFKPIVMAMGLEEGVIDANSTFYCNGFMMVGDWKDPIKCHIHPRGHGTQTTEKALMNSCNPAMMQISQRLGNATFYEYIQDFGFLNKTNVDLQGERVGEFWPESEFENDIVSLAVGSFGQRFEVTPIALITAISAVINGGHLMEPYVVQSVTGVDGELISYHEPKEVRQVISQETSDLVRSMMVSVVEGGGGKNARVSGYSIGGKTGTSQTLVSGHLITSFVGFAPAEDPEIVVLLAFDHPKPSGKGSQTTAGGHYISGGSMAAPTVGPLIADILDYLGNAPSSGEGSVAMPNLLGKSLEEARSILQSAGLGSKLVGKGGTVTDQTPRSGVSIPNGSTAVLYLDAVKSDKKVTVPDLTGRTYSAAKKALENSGLYIKTIQVEDISKLVAFDQSVEAGTQVEPGTVVEVRFMDNSVQGTSD